MWTADNWKDYEVIDTCGGEKLESLERLRFITKGSRVIDDPDSFMNGCEHCKNADKNREDQTF